MNKPVDPTPDHIFIKVYPARLRALAREYGLGRAEIGELVLLACYVDGNGTCYPSKRDSVEKIGMRSARWARTLQARLARKGVIKMKAGGTVRGERFANTFELPNAFIFGNDSYQMPNSAPGGVPNSAPGGVPNSAPGKRYDSAPQQEPLSTKTKINGETAQQHSPPKEGAADVSETHRLAQRLAQAGVKHREAALIAQQYSAALIESVLRDREKGGIANPGGWIRAAIERRAGRVIQYPDKQQIAAQVAATAAALKAATVQDETVDPYLRGSYFQQQDNSTE